jgi:RNA polymerase sigma-70 factor (ECF subfamily)
MNNIKDVSVLLRSWSDGDESALARLIPAVHAELHRLAHKYMAREQRGHPLQTTALINEAYLRLVQANQVRWRDRAHFFAVSASIMRRILIDVARTRQCEKRGGRAVVVPLDDVENLAAGVQPDLVALNDALTALGELDERKAKVVELRFFGGLNVEEAAEVLKISTETVSRDWSFARAWLRRKLAAEHSNGPKSL